MFFYDILLQRCRKASWKKLLAQLHSSPLCFTLIHNASLSLMEFFPKRHKFCSYAVQKVITNIPKSENQLDWWKGIGCWRTCQKSKSTDVAEKIKPVYNINWNAKLKRYTGTQSWKGIHENTSLSNIYWRFYWPGSYAPRGVIDQCICLQMGAPLFLLALLQKTRTFEFVKLLCWC